MNLLLIEPQDIVEGRAIITDAKRIQHIHRILGLQAGECLKVGICGGLKGSAQIESLTPDAVVLTHIECNTPPPKKHPLTLVLCLPRPKVLRRVIADSVAQGVEKIILLHSYRVEKSYWQTPFLAQLDAYLRLGLEQAGDTVAPIIQLEKRFKPFVEDKLPLLVAGKTAIVAHPYAANTAPVAINSPCVVVVGPEGGLIPYEVDLLAKHGCMAVTLGERILRTETAIIQLVGRLYTA